MSVHHCPRAQAALSKVCKTDSIRHTPDLRWAARSALVAGALAAVSVTVNTPASAVPSYARQTGQTCATCHTAFPELTPYGRQFKLMGYTAGGTRCNDGSAKSDEVQIPLSGMTLPTTLTSVRKQDNYNTFAAAPNVNEGAWFPGQSSLFVAGQLYCDVGAFAQMTYDPVGNAFTWDNFDIRYARSGVIDGTNIVYGITANNNPTVQDVWNTAPAWMFPYIDSAVGITGGSYGTMLGTGAWGQQVGGVGGYVWLNRSIYAELSVYNSLSARLLKDWNGGYDPAASRIDGSAPYWRLAYEWNWDKYSLMFGTFGMYADQRTAGEATPPGVTDATLDVGFDTQFQWITREHAVTIRAAYIWENKSNSVENSIALASGAPLANSADDIYDFNISATYIYDRKVSFTTGWFNTWGTTDANLYGAGITPGLVGSTANGSPNSSFWKFDVAYMPFNDGGPDFYPWLNARIGVLYTHFDKFDGTATNIDQSGLKAVGNDFVFFYTWLAF